MKKKFESHFRQTTEKHLLKGFLDIYFYIYMLLIYGQISCNFFFNLTKNMVIFFPKIADFIR